MAIIRNRRKNRSFVMLDNSCIQDERLSWRARGLLHYLLSLPADWVINVQDLINRAPDDRDAVYSIIKELRQVGYIQHERHRGNKGALTGAQYHVFEVPESDENNEDITSDIAAETEEVCPEQDLPSEVEPECCEPGLEKPDTYNINNIQNTQYTKETAAAAAIVQNNNSFEQPEKTEKVEITFINHDVLITNKLTPYQHMRVNALAARMILHVPYLLADELAKQIAESLISQQSVSQWGRDFHRKLNSIQKTILKSGWTPPLEIEQFDRLICLLSLAKNIGITLSKRLCFTEKDKYQQMLFKLLSPIVQYPIKNLSRISIEEAIGTSLAAVEKGRAIIEDVLFSALKQNFNGYFNLKNIKNTHNKDRMINYDNRRMRDNDFKLSIAFSWLPSI